MRAEQLKPVRIFPILHDISDFIQNVHPVLHPETSEYLNYWEKVEQKCLEGIWGLDKNKETGEGGYRYMPNNLYYYINVCKIVVQKNKGTDITSPWLRDIEWIFSYGWLVARGFSGYEDDEEVTCHRVVYKIEQGLELTPEEELELNLGSEQGLKVRAKLLKADGTYKKYVDALEYLYMTHEKPLGNCLYENHALNLMVLSARGIGKSFYVADAIVDHEFRFFGKKKFDTEYLVNPSPVEIVIGAGLEPKSKDLIKKWQLNNKYIRENIGSYGSGEDFYPGFFDRSTSGTLEKSGDKLEHKYEYKEGGEWQKGGSLTSIDHVVFTSNNPQAAVGKRPTVIVVEETGLVHNLLAVHGANETTQIRDTKFGSTIYIGTAGNMEKITEPKLIFENPDSYNCVRYPDVFENRAKGIGLFIPGYMVDNRFKDAQGNTKIEIAFDQEMYNREQKKNSSDSSSLDEYMMSRPLVPSEMFINNAGNYFPVAQLRQRLVKVEIEQLFQHRGVQGHLEYINDTETKVKFVPDTAKVLKPIIELNLDSSADRRGAITIYEAPVNLTEFRYKNSLYKVVYDPVKDSDGGPSNASVLVYKGVPGVTLDSGLKGTIVAEYLGRLDEVSDMHEIAIRLALYYNAPIMPEINIPGFIDYCKLKKRTWLLANAPEITIKQFVKNPNLKNKIGVYLSTELKIAAEQLLRQKLIKVVDVLEDGSTVTFTDTIYSPRVLKELIQYNRNDNFDHASSLLILVLWLNEEESAPITYEENRKQKVEEIEDYLKTLRLKAQAKRPAYVY
jgi:hypothetical protein